MKRGAGKSASGYALRGFAGAATINDLRQEAKTKNPLHLHTANRMAGGMFPLVKIQSAQMIKIRLAATPEHFCDFQR